MGTAVVALIILALVVLVIWSMRRDKKQGKSPICGGNCSACHGCHTPVNGNKGGCETDIRSVKR